MNFFRSLFSRRPAQQAQHQITIEFEPPFVFDKCPCCGGQTTRLTRFVYRDGDAFACYYAEFTPQHEEQVVGILTSIGDWGEDAPSSMRQSFYLVIWSDSDNYKTSIRDAAESPWGEVESFGRTLDREEALAHPRLQDVFDITDAIVTQDEPIIEYLTNEKPGV